MAEITLIEAVTQALAYEIALTVGLSESAVRDRLAALYRRIGVTDRTQAAIWAKVVTPRSAKAAASFGPMPVSTVRSSGAAGATGSGAMAARISAKGGISWVRTCSMAPQSRQR